MPRKTAPYLKQNRTRATPARRKTTRRSPEGGSRNFLFILILLGGGCFGGVAVAKVWLENKTAVDVQLWDSQTARLNSVRTEIKNLEPVRGMYRSADYVLGEARKLGLHPPGEDQKITVPTESEPAHEPIDLVLNP
ncbi:MAG: hypothetical protein ACI8W8_003662 [Rhodothermales bacterium]|jgi:hypothetical protein